MKSKQFLLFRVTKDILTIKNGEDYCSAKVSAFASLWAYMGFATYMLHHSPDHFSLSEFAIGIATIIGAGAVGSKIKETTEPE